MIALVGVICLAVVASVSVPMWWLNCTVYLAKVYKVMFASITLAVCVLLYALIVDDFQLAYVTQHSHQLMPTYLKLSALWGSHAGTWLYMIWLLLGWGSLVPFERRGTVVRAAGIMSAGLLLFDSPFKVQYVYERVPIALNPLLQDIGMMIHPPILLAGYIGAIVPWLCICGQGNRLDIKQLQISSLAILSLGLLLGAWWSYRVLGWGGYWAWDPVEVVALIPWLLQVVCLHEKSDEQIYWLTYLTAWMTLICVFLARANFLESVHTFLHAEHVVYFYFALVVGLSIQGLLDKRVRSIRFQHISVLLHPEFLYFALLLMMTQLFGIGTLFGIQLGIGEHFYQVLATLFISVILMKWINGRRAWLRVAIITVLLSYHWVWFWGAAIVAMSVEALFVQRGLPRSVQCIHIAFISMVIMLCLHHVYQDSKVVSIAPRHQVNILGHTLSYKDLLVDQNEMRQNLSAKMVLDGNREMRPSMRYYMQRDMMVSKPAILVYGLQEVYILLHEISQKGVATIEVQLHSFLRLLIASVLLMVMGLIKRRSEI